MFSTLIANSMNVNTSGKVHPSYGEIIRQLTTDDARVIMWMKDQDALPVIRFRIQIKGKNQYIPLPTIYLAEDFDNYDMLQVTLENLSRLKIIDLNLDTEYSTKDLYDKVKTTREYKVDKAELENRIEEDKELEEVKGTIQITQFGLKFIEVCC